MQSIAKQLRNPTAWGVGALALGVILALVVAMLYINPPSRKIVTFYTYDAVSVRPGNEVRIAGITVGKVKSLALEDHQVRVEAQVDKDAFVGNQSNVEVRMLTVVGGYYVNLISLGDKDLGDTPVPVERVKMPYNLMRTLADSTKITENVAPKPIKQSLDELQHGLAGTNVESISAIIDAGNSIMSTVDKQRGQVSAILNVSDEYIEALADFEGGLRDIVRKASVIEQTLVIYSEGFGSALRGMGNVFDALAPLGVFYGDHRDDFLEKVRNWTEKARMWVEHNGAIVRGIRAIRRKVESVLDAQQAPPELLATDICMPVPGKAC